MIYQIVLLVLCIGGLFISIVKHGEPKGNFHVGYSLLATALNIWLMYMGGFFHWIH